MLNIRKSLAILAFSSFFAISSFASEKEYDKETGLIIDTGMEVVRANCTACHSAKFITLQRGDRETWLDMIRWMQETQGLWQFDAKTEKTILDYLEKNYAPEAASRRQLLSEDLMPK